MSEDVNEEKESGFTFRIMDEIDNPDYEVYVAYEDGQSFYREFEEDLKQKDDKISLGKILRCMERFSPRIQLPKTKFRHIDGDSDDRKDVYEFKNDRIRVYVSLLPNNIIVLLGGFKSKQDNDIAKVFRHFNDMIFSDDLIITEDEKN
ncbi:MAG: hypothetical protein K2K69_09940 [Muribaculaceae bacterium]|nr:hypothetical protein [Muribaculaceae bacterium]